MSYICSSIKISGLISISEVAKNKVISLMKDDGFNHKSDFVRVGVKSGGCSGLSYEMKFDNKIEENDNNNPNGALKNIAGIFNKNKNVLGMMPHPERMIDKYLSGEDGSVFFENLIRNTK